MDDAEMTCREFVELVTEYIEGALSEERRSALHAHIDECGGCSEYLRQMQLTIRALGDLPLDRALAGGTREAAMAAFREFQAERGRPHE
jgi:hypothetical protein